MTKPIFVLGVGAQKAGTTWLHEYLASLPEVDLGFMKEYHVFDQNYVRDTTPGRKKKFENYLDSFLDLTYFLSDTNSEETTSTTFHIFGN